MNRQYTGDYGDQHVGSLHGSTAELSALPTAVDFQRNLQAIRHDSLYGSMASLDGPAGMARRSTAGSSTVPNLTNGVSSGNQSTYSIHDLNAPEGIDERITYQYALRYAILLDAENEQLRARSQSVSSGTNHASGAHTVSGASQFAVRTVGVASGAPNLNNRTPTLVRPQNGDIGDLSQHIQAGKRHRNWRASLFDFGDNASRMRKDANGGSRLKALGKLTGLVGGSGGGSHAGEGDNTGRLTGAIVRAVARQVKESANESSVHPFTAGCYSDLHAYLKTRTHIEALGERGTVEDLVMVFSDLARRRCGAQGIVNDADVVRTVRSQVDKFVRLLRTVLQKKAQTSREAGQALLKLDDFSEGNSPVQREPGGARLRAQSDAPSTVSALSTVGAAQPDRSICTWLKNVFHVPDHEHRSILAELRRVVTQEKAVSDLRACLAVVRQDQSFVGTPADFATPQAYECWKQREITLLEQLIATSSLKQSFIAGAKLGAHPVRPSSSELASSVDADSAFEYIPASAALHYRMLVQRAVVHDIIGNLEGADPKTPLALSMAAEDLLKQCMIAWRISVPYRTACFLDVVKDYYIEGILPATYLIEAFGRLERIIHMIKPHEWPVSHFTYVLNIEKAIEFHALGCVEDVIEELDRQKPDHAAALRRTLRCLVINDVTCPVVPNLPMPNVPERREEVISVLEGSVQYRYTCLKDRYVGGAAAAAAGPAKLVSYECLGELVLGDCENSHSIFAEPLLSEGDRRFDIAGIVAELEIEYFYSDLMQYLAEAGYCADSTSIEPALGLFGLLRRMSAIHSRHSDRELDGIDTQRLFDQATTMWLAQLSNEADGWVRNALAMDRVIEPATPAPRHSTSAIDLVTCFAQQAATIRRIDWPDAAAKAQFLTRFMQTLCQCFEAYAEEMAKQFMVNLSLPPDAVPATRGSSSPRVSRRYREQALTVGPAVQAAAARLDQAGGLQISADACVKLNNLAVAADRLHELYDELQIRTLTEELGGESRPSLTAALPSGFLFSLQVVHAENLEVYRRAHDVQVDASAQPYVKLSIASQAADGSVHRERIGKTRAVALNAMNPRWNQAFDVELPATSAAQATPVEVRVCTRDGPKRLGHKEKVHCRGYFVLSPQMAAAYEGTQDVMLDLEPSGHLLMRVTVDGERDDVDFFSGRMFRCLGHTLADLQQRLVEQLAVHIREYLRNILVVQKPRFRHTRLASGNTTIERSIHFLKLSSDDSPATVRVTQESCHEALLPLIDYLEENLHVLFFDLNPEAASGVIARVWREILHAFEDILLPPLHGRAKGLAKPLTEADVNNVFDCLQFLKWYFAGGDDHDGVSEEVLTSRRYRELKVVRDMYFMTTKELMEEYMHELHASAIAAARAASSARAQAAETPAASSLQLPQLGAQPTLEDLSRYERPLPPIPGQALQAPRPHTAQQQLRGSMGGELPRPITTENLQRPRFSGYITGFDSSSENLSTPSQSEDVRTPVFPSPATPTLARTRSVWAHRNAATASNLRKQNMLVTDKSDVILRLLRLRYDKDAAAFVDQQLELRANQMKYEMTKAIRRDRSSTGTTSSTQDTSLVPARVPPPLPVNPRPVSQTPI